MANATAASSPNRGGIFYKYNTGGKRSITVDARHPEGLALAQTPGGRVDVVTESFAAGTLERWGLGYEVLRPSNPTSSTCRCAASVTRAPTPRHVTMGPTAQALTGLTFLIGLPDRPPAGWSFSYLDHVGGLPRRRGHLDRAPPPAPDRGAASTSTSPSSNRPPPRRGPSCSTPCATAARPGGPGSRPATAGYHPPAAPGGAYRALGDDRWVVISCRTEAQWVALVEAMGRPAWTDDPRFATLAGRVEHADDLDRHLGAWTEGRDRYEVMDLLQAAGVPAGVVQDAADRLERDPQLAARGHFTMLGNDEVAPLPLEGLPVRMSATPPRTGGFIDRAPPASARTTRRCWASCSGSPPTRSARSAAAGALS